MCMDERRAEQLGRLNLKVMYFKWYSSSGARGLHGITWRIMDNSVADASNYEVSTEDKRMESFE